MDILNHLVIYPNPTQNSVSIEFSTVTAENLDLSIYDITGKAIIRRTIKGSFGQKKETIDLGEFGNGIYQLSIKNSIGEGITKLIVKE